ncbi:MAG: hypothetical protein KJO51_01100 [Gramella sp.]|nr:hypothetical protein [Christiangramia sp.]
MRRDRIDIQKSIERGKVIRDSPGFAIFMMHVTNVLLVGTALFLATFYYYFQFREGKHLLVPSILLGLAFILAVLLIYVFTKLDKLQKIKGTSQQRNHFAVLQIAKKLGWTLEKHGEELSVLYPPGKWYSPNRQVTVIFEDDQILVNAISFGVHDYKSPIFWFGNRNMERTFIDLFRKELEKESPAGVRYL